MRTVGEMLAPFIEAETSRGATNWTELAQAIVAREDEMADALRMAGMQFGAMPEFVAEVLVLIGIGTPPSDEAKALIHAQFQATLDRLLREQRGGDTT